MGASVEVDGALWVPVGIGLSLRTGATTGTLRLAHHVWLVNGRLEGQLLADDSIDSLSGSLSMAVRTKELVGGAGEHIPGVFHRVVSRLASVTVGMGLALGALGVENEVA